MFANLNTSNLDYIRSQLAELKQVQPGSSTLPPPQDFSQLQDTPPGDFALNLPRPSIHSSQRIQSEQPEASYLKQQTKLSTNRVQDLTPQLHRKLRDHRPTSTNLTSKLKMHILKLKHSNLITSEQSRQTIDNIKDYPQQFQEKHYATQGSCQEAPANIVTLKQMLAKEKMESLLLVKQLHNLKKLIKQNEQQIGYWKKKSEQLKKQNKSLIEQHQQAKFKNQSCYKKLSRVTTRTVKNQSLILPRGRSSKKKSAMSRQSESKYQSKLESSNSICISSARNSFCSSNSTARSSVRKNDKLLITLYQSNYNRKL